LSPHGRLAWPCAISADLFCALISALIKRCY
jgi:hypothetical protein